MPKLFKLVLLTLLVSGGILWAAQYSTSSDKQIASLNGEEINMNILNSYYENFLGDNYKSLLRSDEGIKQLADYYINRILLLDYAKKSIDKDNPILSKHGARGTDQDTMYLTALLKIEVQDKVKVAEDEIKNFMKTKPQLSRASAISILKERQRAKFTKELIKNVRKGQKIEYLI
jgi:hypothetical protein